MIICVIFIYPKTNNKAMLIIQKNIILFNSLKFLEWRANKKISFKILPKKCVIQVYKDITEPFLHMDKLVQEKRIR